MLWPPRKWAQRKPTGALVVFVQKGTPQRVAAKLMKDHAVWKLMHMVQNPPTGPLLRATMDEATRRKITIEHPELS